MNKSRAKRNYENLERRIFEGVGKYGIPQIKPTQFTNCDFVGFNYAKTCNDRQRKGVHFFVDDYQFNRVWSNIDRYLELLAQFKVVMSPDFSTYTDFPKAIQIYNHYRKHWVGAYLQEYGIDVIPTISWSTKDSYEWCFDGEPQGGCVAISSQGCMACVEKRQLFLDGYREMVLRLNPDTIIFYGNVPDECTGNIVRVRPFSDKFNEVICNGW